MSTIANHSGSAAGAARQRRFFVVMALVLALPVAIGFAPSFYLRPFSGRSPLPLYLVVHGCVLTAWCTLFAVQAWLVTQERVDLHRRLGSLGGGLAVAVVIASLVTMSRAAVRLPTVGVPTASVESIVVGDTALLVLFTAFVAAAVRLRRRGAAHKRLMLCGALVIIGPAFSREPIQGALDALLPAAQSPFRQFLLLCWLALALYDLVTRRRIHPATWFGLALTVTVFAVRELFRGTPAAAAYVEFLASF